MLFIANPPSALKIKERNRTDGIRIFPVHLWSGKLTYIYIPFASHMREDELYYLYRGRHYHFVELVWAHIAHAWEPTNDLLSLHSMVHCPWIQMNPLHRGTAKSSAQNDELRTLPGAEPVLHCSMEIKTPHQHTRTRGSALKSRCMIFSQRFFHPTFKRKQCMLHCITRLQREQKC